MRNRVWIALALASALGLAGCGGGNPSAPTLASVASVNAASTAPSTAPTGGFKQVVAFGDSLSDDGAYTLAAVSTWDPKFGGAKPLVISYAGTLPYAGGGQFTVNGVTASDGQPLGNWTGQLANDLGISLTPNIVGYYSSAATNFVYLTPTGINPSQTAATCAFSTTKPPEAAATCTNYAQGGSMVSAAVGIGNPLNAASRGGAMTYPVTQQVQNYRNQFGDFNVNQLVTVLAGNNDIFTALGTVSNEIAKGVSQSAAVAAAQAAVAQAADDLTEQIKTILANGGKYVLVYTLPDSSLTPFGRGLPYTGLTPPKAPPPGYVCDNTNTGAPCYLLSNLVQVFNQRLLNDLQGQPVKVLDGYSLLNQEVTNPAQFGFTNVTTPWCNPATTSSLLCNVNTPYAAAGASAANLGTWLFADTVHPTPAGYKVIASTTLQAMKGFGWISQ